MSRRSRLLGTLTAVGLCLPLTMCGAAANAPPAATPAGGAAPEMEESAPKAGAPAQPGYPSPPPPPGAQPSTPAATSSADLADAPQRRAAARAEMDRAQAAVAIAAGDCSAACRALASMERAADHLCDLGAGDPEDHRRCDDARRRVTAARERIKSACGTCP